MFECSVCLATFKRADILSRHIKIHDKIRYICISCKSSFTRKDNLLRHKQKYHREYYKYYF